MMKKTNSNLITQKGLEKLTKELKERTSKLRKEIADKLDEAKAIGDLSENSAYTAALEEYQMNEVRIRELKDQLSKVEVAPDKSRDKYVDIGDEVVLKDLDTNKDVKFSIVGQGEGDPLKNMVSSDSIVGKALVGKSVGDKVSIRLPVGKKRYEIVELN